ncbi:hypothetical protein VTO42DRAFT_7763 [Malbranchea cinnamomea]
MAPREPSVKRDFKREPEEEEDDISMTDADEEFATGTGEVSIKDEEDEDKSYVAEEESISTEDESIQRREKLLEKLRAMKKDKREPWIRGKCRKHGYSWIRTGVYVKSTSTILFEKVLSSLLALYPKEDDDDDEIERVENKPEAAKFNLLVARRLCIQLLRSLLEDLSFLEEVALVIDQECGDEYNSIFEKLRTKGPLLQEFQENDEEAGEEEKEELKKLKSFMRSSCMEVSMFDEGFESDWDFEWMAMLGRPRIYTRNLGLGITAKDVVDPKTFRRP